MVIILVSLYGVIKLTYSKKRKSMKVMCSVTFNCFQQKSTKNQKYALCKSNPLVFVRDCVCNVLFQLLPPDGSSWAVRLCFDVKDHLLESSILRFEMLVRTTFSFFVLLLWINFSFVGEIPK